MTKYRFNLLKKFKESLCCWSSIFILHVKHELVVKGFNVALATLQFLLKLSKVVVQLIQLSYIQETHRTFRANTKCFDHFSHRFAIKIIVLNDSGCTFEFLYCFGTGGNVVLQFALKVRRQ